jgi:hypothetical protein
MSGQIINHISVSSAIYIEVMDRHEHKNIVTTEPWSRGGRE